MYCKNNILSWIDALKKIRLSLVLLILVESQIYIYKNNFISWINVLITFQNSILTSINSPPCISLMIDILYNATSFLTRLWGASYQKVKTGQTTMKNRVKSLTIFGVSNSAKDLAMSLQIQGVMKFWRPSGFLVVQTHKYATLVLMPVIYLWPLKVITDSLPHEYTR